MEGLSNTDSIDKILEENKMLKEEVKTLKELLKQNGVYVLPPKTIGGKPRWNI